MCIRDRPYNVRVAQISNLIIENTTYKGEKIGYINSQVATQFIHGNFDRVIRSTVDANGFKDESEWTAGLSNWSYSTGANGNVGTEKVRSDLKYLSLIHISTALPMSYIACLIPAAWTE